MKFNKILIITLILLAFFMISSVSASENITEISEIPEEEVISTDDSEIASEINITFEKQIWAENLSDIKVELPDEANGTFSLKIDTLEIYNQTITNKSLSIPIELPKPAFPYIIANLFPPIDCNYYEVTAFYNDIELNITQPLIIMKYSPNYNYWWRISDEILQYYTEGFNVMIFPRSANGIAEIYVDNKLINKTNITGPYFTYDPLKLSNLSLGNHTAKFIYYNDTYYHDTNETFTFEVVNVKIHVPNTVNIDHDDCVLVNVLKNTSGTVKIYIDNELIYTSKTDKYGEVLMSLADYLKYNSSEIKVEFIGKDYNRTKTVPINITYDFGYYNYNNVFSYGEENIIELNPPANLNRTLLNITIHGGKYNLTPSISYDDEWIELNISELEVGNYSIIISYPGDDKFAPKTESYNFTVIYDIKYPFYLIEYNDKSVVYLNLPSDASGNLTVYVNDTEYKSVKMSNGTCKIRIDNLAPGYYTISVKYNGNDYEVNETEFTLNVYPKVSLDSYFASGQNKYIKLEVPKDCKGYVIFEIDNKKYKVNIKKGTAKLSLKNLKAGEHDIYLNYYGADGFETSDYEYVIVYKPKIKLVSSKSYSNLLNVKVKVYDKKFKAIKNAVVTFKIKGKTVKAKTNKKGIATVKSSIKLKAGKNKITVECNGAKLSKKLTIRHVVSLKTVKVKRFAKKTVLSAKLKNTKALKSKTVTFKFNGKSYKAKTNSKGIAEVTVKLPFIKPGKTVRYQATYLKDTVTKTLKIKR